METGTEKQDTLIKSVNGSYHNSTAIAYDAVMMSTYSEWINNKLTLCFVHVLIVSSFQHISHGKLSFRCLNYKGWNYRGKVDCQCTCFSMRSFDFYLNNG